MSDPVRRRTPTIDVGVFVIKNGKFLIGRRGPACARGAYCWALPGGHIDTGQTPDEATVREVYEETGVVVVPRIVLESACAVPGLLTITDHWKQWDHMTMWMLATYVSGEPVVKEPTKFQTWTWVSLADVRNTVKHLGYDTECEQYHWTPIPLWEEILRFPGVV